MTAVVALAVFLFQLDVIDPTEGQRAGLGFAAAAIAAITTIIAAVAEFRARRGQLIADKTLFRLRSLAFAVQDITEIDVRELGLACYLLRPRKPWRWRPTLARVARDRAEHRPVVSGIRWRPGKGVIGRCVVEGAAIGTDLAADQADYTAVSEADWRSKRVPENVVLGLGYEEFIKVRGKFHTVIAVPMIDAGTGTVVGCVALDGPKGSLDRLWIDDVRNALTQGADDIAELVL